MKNKIESGVGDGQSDATVCEAGGNVVHLEAGDLPQLLVRQRVEHYDLVQPIQQLWPKIFGHLRTIFNYQLEKMLMAMMTMKITTMTMMKRLMTIIVIMKYFRPSS